MYLEKTYGSAYGSGQGHTSPEAPPSPSANLEGSKGNKSKTAKHKQQRAQTPPPDGGRFDLRCDVDLAFERHYCNL